MAAPAKPPLATYADIVALPPHVTGQLIDGTLYTHARPAMPHTRAASALGVDLGGPFDRGRGGPGGWILLDEPELHLRTDVVVLDLAGWRRERLPAVPSVPYLTLAPNWACEILSPSTASLDRGAKLRVYAREAVPWIWLVDPIGRTLEVLALDGPTFRIAEVHTGTAPVRARPFEAIELELEAIFPAAEPAGGTG
jgi:Uma2 family endonuclease